MIYTLIPIAIGQEIDKKVFKGLAEQTVPNTILICGTKGVLNSQGNRSMERTLFEVQTRILCVNNAKKLTCDYVLSIDRDIVLDDTKAIDSLLTCLKADSTLGAVALWFGKYGKTTVWLPHIYFKCILFKRTVFANLDFSKHNICTCTCNTIRRQIENMNLRIRYLDFVNRGYELTY